MVVKYSLLQISELLIGYHAGKKQQKSIAGPLDLTMEAGQLICLLGPNGCGKSTLIRTIAGLQPALSGSVTLQLQEDDRSKQQREDLLRMKPAQLARKLSLVLTDNVRSGNLDVYTVVALGRYPYSGWLGVLSTADKQIIESALSATQTAAFRDRKMDSLSDGECQKVMLARAIAQDTPLVILDEPTAHLDLPSRIQLMRLLHQLAKETNKAILISTHELDLALQVADQLWLMTSEGKLQSGMPEELILNGSFQRAFDKDGVTFDAATGNFNLHESEGAMLQVIGDSTAAFWTRKALLRKGFAVHKGELTGAGFPVILLEEEGERICWIVQYQDKEFRYCSLSELLNEFNVKLGLM